MANPTASSPSLWQKHGVIERNSILLLIGILIVIAIGGLVEVVPLFYLKSTIETADGMRPYTPLELAGRNIYVSEGCYLCHSQMIRALRDEVERYGHYSLAAESQYDHPFQWGSKRNGPDLARVGGKYSDDWHRDHLNNPRAVVASSIMPAYPWLFTDRSRLFAYRRGHESPGRSRRALYGRDDRERLGRREDASHRRCARRRRAGAPLSEGASAQFRRQSRPVTEADALIAYLQMLGTLVDFKLYDDKANIR